VQYNDHELPSQLSPDQYFKLEWALSKDRQELAHTDDGESGLENQDMENARDFFSKL